MDGNINALIAGVGRPQAEAFDYAKASRNALQNQLYRSELEAKPQRLDLMEREMQLRELALDIKAKAMQSGNESKPISLDYDWGTISGDPQKVYLVADAVSKYPDQALQDPNFMPWVAQNGVSIKAKEKKISPYGEEALSFADKKAQIEAKYRPQEKEKGPTEKYTKEDTLVVDALMEELKREPTASEVLIKKKQIAREMSGERRTHVLPEKAMDNMNGALDSMRLIDELSSVSDEALGVPGIGPIKMWVKSKLGSDKAQLFLNNLRQLKINAQTLIKGIPSNFDVQTFINSLPKEDDTPKEVTTKVKIARTMLEDALITGMQNYEKQYEIPEYMRERFEASNIKGSMKPAAKKTIRYDAQGNRVE